MTEGSIDLSDGEADPLKGPTDVGTARSQDEEVALSSLVEKLNERFGTDFTEADQLFFDQIRVTAEQDEKIVEAAHANNLANFSAYLERMLDELFIDRMEGNEEIFSRVMTDKEFRAAAHEHLARKSSAGPRRQILLSEPLRRSPGIWISGPLARRKENTTILRVQLEKMDGFRVLVLCTGWEAVHSPGEYRP